MVYNIYFDWYWSVKTLADTWHLNKSRCIRAYAHVHKCWSAVITVVALNDVARIFWSLFWGFLKHLSIAPPEAFHSTFQFLNWFRRIEKQKSFQRREKSGVNRKSAKMDNLSAASFGNFDAIHDVNFSCKIVWKSAFGSENCTADMKAYT